MQALKKMNEGHEDKGEGKEDNANEEVTVATEDKKRRQCSMPRPRLVATNLMGMALLTRVGPATLHMKKA